MCVFEACDTHVNCRLFWNGFPETRVSPRVATLGNLAVPLMIAFVKSSEASNFSFKLDLSIFHNLGHLFARRLNVKYHVIDVSGWNAEQVRILCGTRVDMGAPSDTREFVPRICSLLPMCITLIVGAMFVQADKQLTCDVTDEQLLESICRGEQLLPLHCHSTTARRGRINA